MSPVLEDATTRILVALGVLVSGVLSIALPSLLTIPTDPSSTAVALLALAFAALLGFGMCWMALAARSVAAVLPTGDAPPVVLPGRVTDPAHHPIRPRAPGPA